MHQSETRWLNEQARRNRARFPEDFVFASTAAAFANDSITGEPFQTVLVCTPRQR